MKSFLGVAVTLLQDLKGQRLKAPLHLALSYDEEVGCLGAPRMLQDLKDRGIRPAGCIVGEPTSMQVVTAHKGTNAYRCTVHGQAAHSSLRNKGVNAIEYAARIVCLIADLADAYETAGPFDDAFDVPFTTAQTGVIQGGIAINTIPDLCEFLFEFRNLPSLPAAELLGRLEAYANDTLLPRMRERAPGAQIRFERLAQAPALESDEAAEITRLVRALARDTGLTKVSYGTEGGQFQEAGIPAVICGPGDIRQAHRPDEFIALEQIVKCERFLAQLADKTRLPS
jgi:acetylornithine deacetylase